MSETMVTVDPNHKKKIEALAGVFAFTAALGGPYMAQDMKDFYCSKPRRIVAVLKCHVCGATNVTLYKDGENRICRKCREKENAK